MITLAGRLQGMGASLPKEITDFSASDNADNSVTVTFTESLNESYALYKDGTLVASNINTNYVYGITGPNTSTYYVRATNLIGTVQSNSNSGTAEGSPAVGVTNFSASDSSTSVITMNFTQTAGQTYSLYKNGSLVTNSCYNGYGHAATGTYTFYVISHGPDGSTAQSNSNSGTGIVPFGTHTIRPMNVGTYQGFTLYGVKKTYPNSGGSLTPNSFDGGYIKKLYFSPYKMWSWVENMNTGGSITFTMPTGDSASINPSGEWSSVSGSFGDIWNYFSEHYAQYITVEITYT